MATLTRSKQPRKQRKALFNASLHVRHRLMTARLSEDLQRQYGVKRLPVRKGDTVLILRGVTLRALGGVRLLMLI